MFVRDLKKELLIDTKTMWFSLVARLYQTFGTRLVHDEFYLTRRNTSNLVPSQCRICMPSKKEPGKRGGGGGGGLEEHDHNGVNINTCNIGYYIPVSCTRSRNVTQTG